MYAQDFLDQVRTQLAVKEDPAKLRQAAFETSSGLDPSVVTNSQA